MMNVGIFDGDILIVDRHQFINDGAVIVATLNGEFVCKKLDKAQRRLVSTKPYSFYQLSERDRFQVEGCVIASVRLHSSLNMSLN
jgi:DNA polymerase V